MYIAHRNPKQLQKRIEEILASSHNAREVVFNLSKLHSNEIAVIVFLFATLLDKSSLFLIYSVKL